MNKKILFLILLAIVALPVVAFADQACNTINAVKTITEELGVAIVVIGWIITGVLYLTAGGAPDKLGLAKKALVACVIGTAVIVLSTIAYNFVQDALQLGSGSLTNC